MKKELQRNRRVGKEARGAKRRTEEVKKELVVNSHQEYKPECVCVCAPCFSPT